MANIFRKKDAYIDRVNRSTFDLSFVNNLTMKFGAITPVCLLPASFGDSFQINARFNLQLLPTVFPIQTQLYVRLHFVYVRTRTLWEDWMAFFGGDESQQAARFLSSCLPLLFLLTLFSRSAVCGTIKRFWMKELLVNSLTI